MVVKHRSRHQSIATPDIRSLRRAIGMTLDEAGTLLGEPPSLIQSQEEGGSSTDIDFIWGCADGYIGHIITGVQSHQRLQVVDSQGTPLVYWLRHGLGLSIGEAAAILWVSESEIEALEDGRSQIAIAAREAAWYCYSDWLCRRQRRSKRRPRLEPPELEFMHSSPSRHDNPRDPTLNRLAYAPPPSKAEAEARARKALGLPPLEDTPQ